MSKLKSLDKLFDGRHFDREIILLCVRWYLRYKLSFRDLVEMIVERGLSLVHTTILRWVRRFAPEFIKRWNRFGRSAGRSWRVDRDRARFSPPASPGGRSNGGGDRVPRRSRLPRRRRRRFVHHPKSFKSVLCRIDMSLSPLPEQPTRILAPRC